MNFLLEVTKNEYGDKIIETLGPAETLIFGGQMVLIGMLTVFSVLIIIWIALSLFKVFFRDASQEKPAPVTIADPVAGAAPTAHAPQDAEIIAVIAAAIAMAESENNGVKFRVVSFRRK